MRRLRDILHDVAEHCPEDMADYLTRAWLAVHTAERHLADIRETVACLETLPPDAPAVRAATQWLLAELHRHVDAVHAAVLFLRPKDAPADVGWAREYDAGSKDK